MTATQTAVGGGYRNDEYWQPTRVELPLGWGFLQIAGGVDERMYGLASAQRGLVTRVQLLAVGMSRSQVETRLGRRQLVAIYRGVYTTVPGPLAPAATAAAALLACAPGVVLSHLTAFNLWHLLPRAVASDGIHVTDPAGGRGRGLRNVTLHRTQTLHRCEQKRIDGLQVTSVERTLLDCAPLLRPDQLGTALDEALAKRLTSFAKLAELLRRHPYGPGQARLRALTRDRARQPVTKEEAEARFLRLVRAAGLPEPQTQALVHGQSIDAYWPEARFGVEVDSRTWHVQPRKFDNDRRKQQVLKDHGVELSRTTWNQINNEPLQLIAHVSGQIMTRRARLREAA